MFYSWKDLDDDINDMGHQIARQSKDFACYLWDKYPKQFVGNNPVANPIRNFWNNLCNPPTIPPPPPFEGGQCNDLPYYCECIYKGVARVQSSTFYGKVGAIDCYVQNGNQYIIRVYRNNELIASGSAYSEYPDGSPITPRVKVQGNLPDTCGNPPTNYPDNPPPQPGDETKDIDFNVEGDENNNFTFPLVWNEVDFKVPLKFDFEVGNVNFNFDGINLNFNDNNEWKINNNSDDLTQNFNSFKKQYENDNNIIILDDLTEDVEEDVDEKEETKSKIEAIIVEVIDVPKKGKTIVFPNTDDNTYFAGYFCWKIGDYRAPEEPIRKEKNIFVKPKWADGYRVYSVNLSRLTIKTYSNP